MEYFKDAKFVRLDGFYYPELKKKVEITSDYWMTVDVKTDKDGDSIIVLYIGKKIFSECFGYTKSMKKIKNEKISKLY